MHSPADQERLEAVMAACHQAKAAADLARARPISAGAMTSLSMAEQVLGSALGKLAALIDAETKLKGEPRLRELTDLLANTDGQLAFSRQLFNDAARTYNEAAHQLPTRLLSNLFGFRRAAMLQVAASDAERANSRVQ
jgi:LemA protein